MRRIVCRLAKKFGGGGAKIGAGRPGKDVNDDMELLSLQPGWAIFRDVWRDLIWGKRLALA